MAETDATEYGIPVLHRLLRKLSDLGVPLVSVTRTDPKNAEAPASTTPTHPTRRSTT